MEAKNKLTSLDSAESPELKQVHCDNDSATDNNLRHHDLNSYYGKQCSALTQYSEIIPIIPAGITLFLTFCKQGNSSSETLACFSKTA